MRHFDDFPLEPGAEASLAVIDQTLAGEAVDPEYAELAELTLILAGQRPVPTAAFSVALDKRVAGRFAAPARASARRGRRRGPGRRWLYAPGAAAGLAVAIAVVVVVSSGGSPKLVTPNAVAPLSATATSAAGSTRAAPSTAGTSSAGTGSAGTGSAGTGSAGSELLPSVVTHIRSPAVPQASPTPPTGGRQVVQSAQLSLSTRPDRVDDVSQQVYDVVGAQSGVVDNSTVTANGGAGGYAQFQLSVPSSNLESTMSALSNLQGATVVSRTDSSQDITGQAGGAGRALADARALRRSLLKQLAAATTTQEIDSLKIQLHDAEASIDSDLSTLNSLHRKVAFTQISVTINASMVPGHPVSSGDGFTIGRAAHDAGRVLVVAAGVALIALAVLVPLGLLAAVIAWLGLAVRRRRREQALDLL